MCVGKINPQSFFYVKKKNSMEHQEYLCTTPVRWKSFPGPDKSKALYCTLPSKRGLGRPHTQAYAYTAQGAAPCWISNGRQEQTTIHLFHLPSVENRTCKSQMVCVRFPWMISVYLSTPCSAFIVAMQYINCWVFIKTHKYFQSKLS